MNVKSSSFLIIFPVIVTCDYFFPKYADILTIPQNAESYFGFSVQLQYSNNEYGRVVVGAPRANSSIPQQKYLKEPGAVYSCSLYTKKCEQFVFENEGNTNGSNWIDNKDYSSLGFSLDVDENTNGRLLACAPRWVNRQSNLNIYKQNGMCYYLKNSSNVLSNAERLMPYLKEDLQFENWHWMYILGQAGFSSQLIKGTQNIVLTGLGLQNWTGSVVQYTDNSGGRINYVLSPKTATLETYSYFGYSTLSGRFNSSDLSKIFYISGAPRQDNLTGRVFLYEELKDFKTFIKRYEFPGQQFGEYFGASLAVADINGDKVDDIVIGAPMHSTEDQEEVGCIYTFITEKYNGRINVKKNKIHFGDVRGSRFGTSMSSLGDINKDGFEDIVIGAPYEDSGAIYLYLGQNGNKGLQFVQKILASDFNTIHLKGFGYSLSRGLDIDSNNYNDLAIGAYQSGHVVVLKSRPIVKINTNLESSIHQVDVNTTEFTISACLKYTGISVPTSLNVTIELDVNNPQVTFDNRADSFNKVILFKIDVEYCETVKLYVADGLRRDVLITMSYKMMDHIETEFCKNCPIEENLPSHQTKIIPFATGCKETICKSNLKLSAYPTKGSLTIGSNEPMEIFLSIENTGENSFDTKLCLEFSPDNLQLQSENSCSRINNNYTCKFMTPILTNDKRDLKFTLNAVDVDIVHELLQISMFVTSVSEETDKKDNYLTLEMPLLTDIKYNITSSSEPEQIVLTEEITKLFHVLHTYNVESIGITDLEDLNIFIDIPYEYNNINIYKNINIVGCTYYKSKKFEISGEKLTNERLQMTTLNCSSANVKLKCERIKCEVRNEQQKLKTAKIQIIMDITTQIMEETMNTIYIATILKTDSQYLDINSSSTTSFIFPPKAASFVMYYIIAIICSLITLVILGYILYKCKFFKRKHPPRPEDTALLDTNEDEDKEKKTNKGEEVINDLYITSPD